MRSRNCPQEMARTSSFNCIDLVKFICCILVVAIHTSPLKDVNETANYYLVDFAARLAVPFFFITSGFLTFRKTDGDSPDPAVPLKFAGKIFRLYALWTIIYLPIICYTVSLDEGGITEGIRYQIWRFFFAGTATQFWYLHSTVVVMLLLALLLRWRMGKKTILLLSALFYVIGLLSSAYSFLSDFLPGGQVVQSALEKLEQFDYLPHRALNYAFLYISIGMVMAWSDYKISGRKAWGLFAVFSGLLLGECALLHKGGTANDSGNLLLLPAADFCLVRACLNTPLPDRPVYKKLRKLSSLIFYIHIFVLRVFSTILEYAGGYTGKNLNSRLLLFLGTAAISYALSELILYLAEKKGMTFLKALYGEYRREKKKEEEK